PRGCVARSDADADRRAAPTGRRRPSAQIYFKYICRTRSPDDELVAVDHHGVFFAELLLAGDADRIGGGDAREAAADLRSAWRAASSLLAMPPVPTSLFCFARTSGRASATSSMSGTRAPFASRRPSTSERRTSTSAVTSGVTIAES